MANERERQGGYTGDEVLAYAHDRRARSIVTVVGAYVPDYTEQPVLSITGDMDDPNTTPPVYPPEANSNGFNVIGYGVLVLHAVLPAGGSMDLELWVDGGKDANGNDVGYLLAATMTNVATRAEFTQHTGQRRAYIRAVNTVGIGDGVGANPPPATLRVAGVA